MPIFLKTKTCPKCDYTGNMDCWTNSEQQNVCKCPVCKTTFIDIQKNKV